MAENFFSYYDIYRPKILDAVPLDAKNILSVGCGAGRTEEELVRRGRRVYGVEIDPEAAKRAERRGITIIQGDAENVDIGKWKVKFDFLIYADILEHLADPQEVLKKHVRHLNRGGTVFVSVPNFRHYSILSQIIFSGKIRYTDSGILDHTHLRITTRKMIAEWFSEVNISLARTQYIFWGRKDKIISRCLLRLADEFVASQIFLIGRNS